MLYLAVMSLCIQKEYNHFCFKFQLLRVHLCYSPFTYEKQKEARDVFNTFATHASLVSDVTDIDCSVQTGSSRGRVFSKFQTSSFDKQDEKLSSKLLCVYFYVFRSYQ